MKRTFCFSVAALLLGVSSLQGEAPKPASRAESAKVLVAYYSHSGNTRQIAEFIQRGTGGKLIEIKRKAPYPQVYRELTDAAKKEIESGTLPEIDAIDINMTDYDVVFIGSPNWWGTLAPPAASFLSRHNLSGKTVIPFMTHGGSGLGRSLEAIRKLCPESTVLNGRAFFGSRVKGAEPEVGQWLETLPLVRPEKAESKEHPTTLKLTVGEAVLTASLLDNATTRDFTALLPMKLTLNDYAQTEKISMLSQKLSTEEAPEGFTPSPGDLAYYVPWGNLALFYKDYGYARNLIRIGKIEGDLKVFSGRGNVAVTIEAVKAKQSEERK